MNSQLNMSEDQQLIADVAAFESDFATLGLKHRLNVSIISKFPKESIKELPQVQLALKTLEANGMKYGFSFSRLEKGVNE